MTHQELLEWQAYYKKEPFHTDRSEMQLATLSFLISASNGGKSSPSDFLISHTENHKKRSRQTQKGFVASLISK